MAWIVRFAKWIWRGFEIFAPIAGVLWGATVYSGIAFSLWVIVDQTQNLIGQFSLVFASWADSVSTSVQSVFESATGNSFFQFAAYVLSLDVPFEWFRSCADSFLRFWLTYALGAFVGVIEVCVVVLGVMFVRSRLKKISFGMDAGGGLGGGL